MKSILNSIIKFVVEALAVRAEFGAQMTIPGLAAGADLSAQQYRVMRMADGLNVNITSETAVTSLGAQQVVGVLQNKPKSGEAATVAYFGLSKAIAGAATTANLMITHNASGQVINAVSGSVVFGRTIEAAGAAGEVSTVLLFPPVRWGAIL